MRRALVIVLVLLLGAAAFLPGCGDDGTGPQDDAAVIDDGSSDVETGADAEADGEVDGPRDEAGEGAADADVPEDVVDVVDVLPSVTAAPSADLLPAADPKLPGFGGWPVAFDVDPGGRRGLRCRVALSRGPTALGALEGTVDSGSCAVVWDGRAPDGSWLTPGAVAADLEVLPAGMDEVLVEAAAELEVVRLGIHGIQLSPATVGKRVDLLWAEMGGVAEGYFEAARDSRPWSLDRDAAEPTAAVDLELADGSPRPLPELWTDLKSPPLDDASADGVEHDTCDLPTAWVAGAIVEVSAQLSSDVAGETGGGAPSASEVRVVAPGGTRLVGEGAFVAGGTVVVRSETSPVPAVGRTDWPLTWRFEARRAGGPWVPVPGGLTTLHRLYGVVGVPVFASPDVPHRAWVEVIDAIAGWVAGASADPVVVAGRIVDGVYNELGLRYDDQFGASAYTEYLDEWNDAMFSIVAFQRRDYGSVINCSDAASIVSAYANMEGIDLRYHIIQHRWAGGFDLNFIRAIGFPDFSETPFRSGGGSFSYHAVTGPADGSIYDATLALDGDGTPTAPPHTLLMAEGLSPHDYLFGLTSQWDEVIIHIDDTVGLR